MSFLDIEFIPFSILEFEWNSRNTANRYRNRRFKGWDLGWFHARPDSNGELNPNLIPPNGKKEGYLVILPLQMITRSAYRCFSFENNWQLLKPTANGDAGDGSTIRQCALSVKPIWNEYRETSLSTAICPNGSMIALAEMDHNRLLIFQCTSFIIGGDWHKQIIRRGKKGNNICPLSASSHWIEAWKWHPHIRMRQCISQSGDDSLDHSKNRVSPKSGAIMWRWATDSLCKPKCRLLFGGAIPAIFWRRFEKEV